MMQAQAQAQVQNTNQNQTNEQQNISQNTLAAHLEQRAQTQNQQ